MLRVRDVMRTQFYSIDPADTMFSAAQQLMLRNVESLMVVDESGELKGIVTERDVLLAALPQDQDVRADQPLLRMVDLMDIARERFDVPVSELMTERVRAISPGTPLTEALDAMLHQRLRRLAVVDPATNEVAGVISQRDVLSALVIGNPRLAARQTGRIRV